MSYTKRYIESHWDEFLYANRIDESSYYEYLAERRISEANELLWEEEIKDNIFLDEEGNIIDGKPFKPIL